MRDHAIFKQRFQWNRLLSKGFSWILILGLLVESSISTITKEDSPPPKSTEREGRSFNLGPFYHRFSSSDNNPAPLRKRPLNRRPPQHRPLRPVDPHPHGPHDLQTAAQTLYDLRGFHIPLGGQEETQRYLRQQNQLSQDQRHTAPLVFPSFFQPQTPHHVQHQDHQQAHHHQPLNIFGHNQHHQQTGRYRNPNEALGSNELEFRPSLPDLGEKSTTENSFKPVARPIPLPQKENQAQESGRSQEADQQQPQLQQDPFIYVYDDVVEYEAEPEKIPKSSGEARLRTNTPTATLIVSPTTTTESPGHKSRLQELEQEADEESLLSPFTTPRPQENLQQNHIPNPFFNQPNHNSFNHDFADSLNHHQLQQHPTFIRARGPVGPKVEIVPSSERKPPPDQSNAIPPVIINTKRPLFDDPPPTQNPQPRPHRIIHNGNQREQERQEEFSQIFQQPLQHTPTPLQYDEPPQIIRQQNQPTYFNTNIINNQNQRSRPRHRLQPTPTTTPQIRTLGNNEQNGAYFPNNPVLIQKLNPYLNSDNFNAPPRLLPVNTLVPQNYLNQFPENSNIIEEDRYVEPVTTTTTTTSTTPEPPTTTTLAERKQNITPLRNSNSLFTRSRLSPFSRSTTTSTTTTPEPPPKRRIRPQLRRLLTTPSSTTTQPTTTTRTTTPEPDLEDEEYELVPDNYQDPNSVDQEPIYEPRPTARVKEFQLPRSTPSVMRTRIAPQQTQPQVSSNPPQRTRQQQQQPQFHVEPQQQQNPGFSILDQFQANSPFQNSNNNFQPEFSHPPLSHPQPFPNFNIPNQRFPVEHSNFIPPVAQREAPRGRKQPPKRNGKPLYVTGKMLEKEGGLYAGLGIQPHHHNYGTPIPVQPRLPGLIEYEQGPVLGGLPPLAVGRRQQQQEHQFLRQSILRQHVPTQGSPPPLAYENINTNLGRSKTLTQSSHVLANADRDRQRERERQRDLERERQRDLERERQRDLERERQRELDRERQRDLERERQRDLERERERQREVERERLREAERERQRELILEREREQVVRQQNLERERERQRNVERERLRQLELAQERETEAPQTTLRPRQRARPGGRRRKVQKNPDQTQSQEQSRSVQAVESTPRYQSEEPVTREFSTVKYLPNPTPTPSVEFSLPPTSKPNPLKRKPPTRVRLNNYQPPTASSAPQVEDSSQGQIPTSSPGRKLRPRARPARPLRPSPPSTPSPTSTAQQAPTEEVNYVTQSSVKIFRKPTEAPGRFSSRYRDETIIPTPLPTIPTVIYDTQPQQQQPPLQTQTPFSSKPRATIRIPTKKPITVSSTQAPTKTFKVQPKPKPQEPESQDVLPSSILLKPKDVLINRKPARRIPPGSASDRLKALQEKRRNLFKNRNNGRNHAPVKPEPELDPREDGEEDEDDDGEQNQSKREITSRHKFPGPKLPNDSKASESQLLKSQIFPILPGKIQNSTEVNSEETAAIVGIPLPTKSRNSTDEDPIHLSWEEVSSSPIEELSADPLSQSESNVRDTSVSAPIVDLSQDGSFKARLLQSPTASQSPFSIFTMSNQSPTLPLEAFFPIVSSPQSQNHSKSKETTLRQ